MESIEQTFTGNPDFGKRISCTISRNGDLVYRNILQVTLPSVTIQGSASLTAQFRWLNWIGHILLKTAEIEIGGQKIDKHYGHWLQIWNELSQTSGKKSGYARMVGNTPAITKVYEAGATAVTIPAQTLFIPLQFWYCRNPGLALPLIALQYHEAKINIELNDRDQCYWSAITNGTTSNPYTPTFNGGLDATLYVDYVYLDTDERRRFAQVSHEYLIEQLQFTGDESATGTTPKIKLSFNHPCKELIWTVQRDDYFDKSATQQYAGLQHFNFTDSFDATYSINKYHPYVPITANMDLLGSTASETTLLGVNPMESTAQNPVLLARLQLNGHDRISERVGAYFDLVQPFQHHENIPSIGINVYSFALRPEDHQPSGTCNMSRIDNATLLFTLNSQVVANNSSAKVRVYAVNFNVFRVMSGMGGLAYSN